MATKETKTAAIETTNNAAETATTIKAKIISVTYNANNGKLVFNTDETFKTIDFATGEEKETSSFGLKPFAAQSQLCPLVPIIATAQVMAMGASIKPQIIALALQGADVEIVREFKEEGEERENDGRYSANCYVTKFKKVATHVAPEAAALIQQLVMMQASQPAQTNNVIINPFAV